MFRSFRKVAQSLSDSIDTAFSNAPASHTAFVNTVLSFENITLRLGSVFAEGGYSFIHKAYLHPSSSINTSNQYYAVKRISCSDSESISQAKHEAQILSQLTPHPNIVEYFGIVFHQDHAFLAMQLIDGGLLSQMLSQPNRPQPLTVLKDITTAIIHLHSQNPPIACRDLKLENVLYDRFNKCYKLCDLGSAITKTFHPITRAQILNMTDDIEANCTAMYRAPEIADLYSKKFICEKVDVWALGCIWYALLYNKLPFDGQSCLQITKGLQNLPKQPTYPPEYITLLHAMLQVDPAKRIDSFIVFEAILMFEGNCIDPQLKQIGMNLRNERAKQYQKENHQIVMSPTIEQLFPNNNFITKSQTPLNNQHRERDKPQSSIPITNPLINFDDITSTRQTVFTNSLNTTTSGPNSNFISTDHDTRKTISQEEEEWADFESAFNNSNTNLSQTKTQEEVTSTFAELNLKTTTPLNNSNTLLIDFGDFSGQPQQTSKSEDKSDSDGKFSNLIDFS